MSEVHSKVELDKYLSGRVVEETFRSESDAPCLASPDGTAAMFPPASPSAINSEENSESDQNDNTIKTKGTLETAKEEVQNQFSCAEITDVFKSQQLTSTPPKMNSKTYYVPKDDTGTLNTDSNPLSSGHKIVSGNNTLITHNKSLIDRQDNTEPLQEDITSTQDSELSAIRTDNFTPLVGSPATKPDTVPLSTPENVSEHLAAKSETFKAVSDSLEQEKHCDDLSATPKKVFSIMLDMEPQVMQKNKNVAADALRRSQGAELFDAKVRDVSSKGFPEKKSGLLISPESDKTDVKSLHPAAQSKTCKAVTDARETEKYREDISTSPDKVFTIVLDLELPEFQTQDSVGARSPDVLRCSQRAELCDSQLTEASAIAEKKCELFTTLSSPESDETDLKIHYLKSCVLNDSQVVDSLPEHPLALVSTELEEVESMSAKLSCKEKSERHELMHNELLNSSESCGTVAECQLPGAAGTTFLYVKQEETTDFCHAKEQTVSSVLCTVERDALTETQIPAKQLTVADTAQSTGSGQLKMAEGDTTEEASDPERPKSKLLKVPERRNKATLLFEESKWKVPASLEDAEVTQRQVDVILKIMDFLLIFSELYFFFFSELVFCPKPFWIMTPQNKAMSTCPSSPVAYVCH